MIGSRGSGGASHQLVALGGAIASTREQPAWRALDLREIPSDGRLLDAHESLIHNQPFHTLNTIWTEETRRSRPVLVVMPMSGHYGWVLYDLVRALAMRHRVCVLDWVNARAIPATDGPFGFDDSIDAIISTLKWLGPGAHLVGICQSAVAALGATAALHLRGSPARPATLSLLGGPIDPDANPTRISTLLSMTPTSWMREHMLTTVAAGFLGADRLVYAGEAQQHGLLNYLARQYWQTGPLAQRLTHDDGSLPGRYPFLTLYTSVKDIPGEAFLDSIEAIYHERSLWTGGLRWQGRLAATEAISDLPLLTIEAPMDDVTAPGQTIAAHALFPRRKRSLGRHLALSAGDHFSLFHGRTCREEVAPALMDFMHDFA
jgi:poly(3-hydroxybutyrate) depolymerase